MPGAECHSARIAIENDTDKPRIVWVEPWGEDYTLFPREKLEIIARNVAGSPWFHLVEHGDSCQVFIENITNDYTVVQDGVELACGHQRKAAMDAGLKLG
jgi:hypothetical protein